MKPLFPDVSVNGRTIPVSQIAAEAQNHRAPAGKPGLAWRLAARSLVIRELLLQEAERRGLDAEPNLDGMGRRETESEAMIRELTEIEIKPRLPAPDDLRNFYNAHPEQFRAPSVYEASHILVAAPESDLERRDRAREHAAELLDLLKSDETAFGRMAKKHSACASAANGGSLGQLSEGDLAPEFEAALELLAPGQIGDMLVETRYGFHLVRLDARARGDVLPFESVRERIAETLEKASWASAGRDFIQRLVDRADISGIDMAGSRSREFSP